MIQGLEWWEDYIYHYILLSEIIQAIPLIDFKYRIQEYLQDSAEFQPLFPLFFY